jgi:hypothetical protein
VGQGEGVGLRQAYGSAGVSRALGKHEKGCLTVGNVSVIIQVLGYRRLRRVGGCNGQFTSCGRIVVATVLLEDGAVAAVAGLHCAFAFGGRSEG